MITKFNLYESIEDQLKDIRNIIIIKRFSITKVVIIRRDFIVDFECNKNYFYGNAVIEYIDGKVTNFSENFNKYDAYIFENYNDVEIIQISELPKKHKDLFYAIYDFIYKKSERWSSMTVLKEMTRSLFEEYIPNLDALKTKRYFNL